MRITLFKNQTHRFCFVIEKQYRADRIVIPIGANCQSAYLLRHLGLLKTSYPFDWLLLTNPTLGMKYILENIKNDFNLFLSDLKKNSDGHVHSGAYDIALFVHFEDLIENKELIKAFNRRSLRFLKVIREKLCSLLYTIDSYAIIGNDRLEEFCETAKELRLQLKPEDELLILIRYETFDGLDKEYGEKLFLALNKLNGIKAIHYVRNAEKYGIWGNIRNYKTMINELGITLTPCRPKIEFEKIWREN